MSGIFSNRLSPYRSRKGLSLNPELAKLSSRQGYTRRKQVESWVRQCPLREGSRASLEEFLRLKVSVPCTVTCVAPLATANVGDEALDSP